ncbi:MAG: site-specific DNA-methyltransferase, partial [Acidimicrobiales bacterium]|nr:site-specific DNA-methyltransferase [Acidimicrobiales bacterium]
MHILQDRLGLLLRGEIIWRKAEGSSGSCAWGSFQSASNPVLRDLTERVIVASKGRFDRALPKAVRATRGLPHVDTVPKDAFMSWTTDVWDMPTESATRVGHPAPYPVELPQRLIELYTYAGDVVLDPFMGSGTTAVAAVTTGRHFIGFDTDEAYLDVARERVDAARAALADADGALPVELRSAVQDGRMAKEVAELALTEAGFVDVTPLKRPVAGVDLAYTARD